MMFPSSLIKSPDKEKMAAVDPAFKLIPRNKTCFYIWRIENMQVVAVPRDQYGNFYKGDSYIVMCPREARGGLDVHLHFWLGTSTTQDEAGIAAYKTVELDDYLGGAPVQHREVQAYESKRFVSYFSKGLRLLEGGAASGFHHVDTTFKARMFHIKGKRKPVLRETPEISWKYMNDGDMFVVNTEQAIFVWTGAYANHNEKIQAAKFAQHLKEENGGGTILVVDDGKENEMTNSEKEYFNEYLPLKEKDVKSHKDTPKDEVLERQQRTQIKLYCCSDEEGTLKVTEVKNGPLEQKDLISMDSYIIDNGPAGIWVWVGKKASHKERTEAMRNAQGFIKKKSYPNHTQVTRVIDGGEPHEFKSLFKSWTNPGASKGLGKTHSVGKIARTVQTKFDAETLHQNTELAAETQMVDDGSGTKEVFRAENFELVPVDKSDYGSFYSGDCYVIVYAYHSASTDHYLIYYWLGNKSTADEKGTAALKTIELDDKLHGKAVQVRIIQGKEPPHFMAMFGGMIIVYEGGKSSGFKNVNAKDIGHGDSFMLQVRGTTESNTKAIQVEKRAASLNSNDVFVIFTKGFTYIWAGKGSTGDEREMAKKVAAMSSKWVSFSLEYTGEPVLIYEGQEKDDFWSCIGGKESYSNDKRLQDTGSRQEPRLFQCSNASGQFVVEEIVNYDQSDLIEDDIMLLDAWDAVFIWIRQDLHAADCIYHHSCSINFRTDRDVPQQYRSCPPRKRRKSRRPRNQDQEQAFLEMCFYLEANDEERITISDLGNKIKEFLTDTESTPYGNQYLKQKLIEHYGDSIYIAEGEGVHDIVTMREKTSQILRSYFKSHGKEEDEEAQKRAIIKTAARLIRSDIKTNVPSTSDEYPSIEMLKLESAQFTVILMAYLNTDPSGRDPSTPIVKIKQGFEPPNFTGFFGVWDRSLWNNNKTYDQLRKELAQDNPGIVFMKNQLNGNNTMSEAAKYPLEVLIAKDPETLPEDVDPSHKEVHLNEDDFKKAFDMLYVDFSSLPMWKQKDIKKRIGLF
ncbi:Villin-1 [Nymphon striatum]|nr:Villin-1 [Nymphon striatum]